MMRNYLCSTLFFTFNKHSYDSRDNKKLKVEYCKSIKRYNNLFYKGLLLFNALPGRIMETNSKGY